MRKNIIYMVQEVQQLYGDMCVVELSKDLKKAVSEPKLLFEASKAPWSVPIPFAKKEFGIYGNVYFVDGLCMHRTKSGRLLMLWSSWGERGYAVGMAYSDNGEIDGRWHHVKTPLYAENGGHGMLFKNNKKELMYALHYPNDLYKERPQIKKVEEKDDVLVLK